MNAQNEVRAMNKDLLKHTVGWVQMKSTTGTKDRTNGRIPEYVFQDIFEWLSSPSRQKKSSLLPTVAINNVAGIN
jgi:hypothetical protein